MPPSAVPIYVGGHSELALRRAARLDGWIGVYYQLDELEAYCEQLLGYREEARSGRRAARVVASPLVEPRPETSSGSRRWA